MKSSHITTPRTMADCQFAMNADPIDRPERPIDHEDKIVLLGCFVVFLAFLVVLKIWG